MAHKTLIGGTAYEIDGGKTLIGGTAYKIDKGKTLVGGTAYEVGFAPSVAMIYVVGHGGEDCGDGEYGQYANSYITYNGVMYTSPTTFEANVGDVIECFADSEDMFDIYVNGVKVSGSGTTYTYTVTSNAKIELYSDGVGKEAYVKITELLSNNFIFYVSYSYYTAEEGMTWAEWCNSEYNIGYYSRLVIEGDYVKQVAGSSYAIVLNDVYVKPTDVIVPGGMYTTKLTPPVPVEVKIQVDNDTYCIVEIDGQSYFGSHVLTLYTRTKITCKVMEWGGKAIITKNGITVASISNHTGKYKSYSYTVNGPATIHGYYDDNNIGGRIDIVET